MDTVLWTNVILFGAAIGLMCGAFRNIYRIHQEANNPEKEWHWVNPVVEVTREQWLDLYIAERESNHKSGTGYGNDIFQLLPEETKKVFLPDSLTSSEFEEKKKEL